MPERKRSRPNFLFRERTFLFRDQTVQIEEKKSPLKEKEETESFSIKGILILCYLLIRVQYLLDLSVLFDSDLSIF